MTRDEYNDFSATKAKADALERFIKLLEPELVENYLSFLDEEMSYHRGRMADPARVFDGESRLAV